MSKQTIVTIPLKDSEGNATGMRRFAVEGKMGDPPDVMADWCSGKLEVQSDQTWNLMVYRRIENRGFVALLDGGGQWADRGDHGTYVGADERSAYLALIDAWHNADYRGLGNPPQCLVSACKEYDQTVTEPDVE